ncbi:hypothetical protein C8A03DRAFT_19611 [Achaetomium macrosporum]|uniref:Uncharacterized protein n=1 Tax=Achaetomium macrosporum TaxID=79813 RepID=A0AAN7H6P9_9PEZI|nr:hypothetical protein C8A03DRAFT_19611 [Achaetomium macrosporum]
MKFPLAAALLIAPLALALDNSQVLPEQELSDDSVAAGAASDNVLKADALNAAAVCPINYPYLCPSGFCCPYSICCSRECCAPDARFCYNGLCYK